MTSPFAPQTRQLFRIDRGAIADRVVGVLAASELLHFETAVSDRIAVPSETDVAFAVIEAFGWMLDLAAVEGIDVDIQYLRAVKSHFDLLAADFDLLEVPFADWSQITVLGTDAVVQRTVILIG